MIFTYKKMYKEARDKQEPFVYKTMKQVEKDSKLLANYIERQSKESNVYKMNMATSFVRPGSLKVLVTREPKSVATVPKSGSRRGKKNTGKLYPAIVVEFYDTFWKDYTNLETFFTVKDFNNWINAL